MVQTSADPPAADPPAPAPPSTPAPPPAAAPPPAVPARSRSRRVLPHLLGGFAALLVYAATRGIGLWALAAYTARHDLPFAGLLTRADGTWYRGIAERGYDQAVPIAADGGPGTTNLAFFPLYPYLVRWTGAWLPYDIEVVQIVVAGAAGLLCAAALYAIGAHLRGPGTGIVLAGLWGTLPHAVVESMGYSESLFTALAAWSLYAVLRRSWIAAALLCVLAGLTRPTGLALVAAVGLAALVAVIRNPRTWTAYAATLIAPLGTLGYVAWVNDRIGRADAYTYIQGEAWNNSFDFGVHTWATLGDLVRPNVPLAYMVTTVVLLTSVALLLAGIGARVPWPMLVYVAGILLLTIGSDHYYWAKGRMLVPAFPLLIPLAYALVRDRSRTAAPIALLLSTTFSAWYGVYVLTQWRGSP